MRLLLFFLAAAIAGIVGSSFYQRARNAPKYFDSLVTREDITETIAVTGYAEPIETHVVKSEFPGVVIEVLVDHGDEVSKGDVLARLSAKVQQAQLLQAEYELQAAKTEPERLEAKFSEAQSGLKSTMSQLDAARRILAHMEDTSKGENEVYPKEKIEAQRDLVHSAEAQVGVAKSQVQQAEVAKEQVVSKIQAGEEAVKLAHVYLEMTGLKSTLDGVVIDMDIHVGDLVGRPKINLRTGLTALFVIAAPLDRMRAIVNVSEADYSRIKVDEENPQQALFTVDAYPDEIFEAKVVQIRNAPTQDATAVTYATVLEFDDRRDLDSGEWMIRPRATISADIEIGKVQNVLAVRNSALLFSPSNFDEVIPEVGAGERLVWKVGPEGKLEHRVIKIGISNGEVTEVLEGDIEVGDKLITGEPVAERSGGLKLPLGN